MFQVQTLASGKSIGLTLSLPRYVRGRATQKSENFVFGKRKPDPMDSVCAVLIRKQHRSLTGQVFSSQLQPVPRLITQRHTTTEAPDKLLTQCLQKHHPRGNPQPPQQDDPLGLQRKLRPGSSPPSQYGKGTTRRSSSSPKTPLKALKPIKATSSKNSQPNNPFQHHMFPNVFVSILVARQDDSSENPHKTGNGRKCPGEDVGYWVEFGYGLLILGLDLES